MRVVCVCVCVKNVKDNVFFFFSVLFFFFSFMMFRNKICHRFRYSFFIEQIV